MPKTNEEIVAKNATRTAEEIELNKNYQWSDETNEWILRQGASEEDDRRLGLLS